MAKRNTKKTRKPERTDRNDSPQPHSAEPLNAPLPRVSICTATYNRARFLPLLQQHILRQTYPRELLEWVIVDDSDDQQEEFTPDHSKNLSIRYERLPQKLTLGKKRNRSHDFCSGDIIVYMDDDDYYPPTRVAHAVEQLTNSDALIAGSTMLPILFLPEMELWIAGPYGKNHATAGTFAFKRELLDQTQYDEEKTFAEEKSFLKNYQLPMVQLDSEHTILCIAHHRNTFDKRRLIMDGKNPRFKKIRDKDEVASTLPQVIKDYGSLLQQESEPNSNALSHNPEPRLVVQRLPRVSLCTVTRNRAGVLPLLLQQILAQTYPRSLMEWVVVDDSTDGSPPFRPTAEELQGLTLNYSHTSETTPDREKRKLAHKLSSGSIIVIFDDDNFYPPSRVKHAVDRLSGGRELIAGCRTQLLTLLPDRQMRIARYPALDSGTAATWAFKRSLLEQIPSDEGKNQSDERGFPQSFMRTSFVELEPNLTGLQFVPTSAFTDHPEGLARAVKTGLEHMPANLSLTLQDNVQAQFLQFEAEISRAMMGERDPERITGRSETNTDQTSPDSPSSNVLQGMTSEGKTTKKRVMIASPVRQKPSILRQFLLSLKRLHIPTVELTFAFVDDNVDAESQRLLAEFEHGVQCIVIQPENSPREQGDYIQDEITHHWKEDLIWKVAGFKDLLIEKALASGMEFLFLVDSDLVLSPYVLEHLISCGKEVVSEVFWTSWKPGQIQLPQVWAQGEYEMAPRRREERLGQEESERRTRDFIRNAYSPNLFRVGGLGACTLIRRSALEKGARFSEIDNLTYWGEDRHFCIRARALGIELWADTTYPPLHLYRESDLETVDGYVKWASRDRWAQPSITLSMVVRNEAGRFLERALDRHRDFIDSAVIIDDASEDNTVDIIQRSLQGVPLKIIKNPHSKFHNEIALRKQQWEQTIATQPDWILNLDADEVMDDRALQSLRALAQQRERQYIGFSLYDMWSDTHYRDDDLWTAHKRSWGFLFRYTPFFAYEWNSVGLHCGRFPANLRFFGLAHTNLRIQHLGWSREEDRLAKWRRYTSLDPEGRFGSMAQYQSILDAAPQLVQWEP